MPLLLTPIAHGAASRDLWKRPRSSFIDTPPEDTTAPHDDGTSLVEPP